METANTGRAILGDDGYSTRPLQALPKDRIHHCHVKNAVKDSAGKIVWSPVNTGYIDWAAQFKALADMGYSDAVNLETHWKDGGTPESSSRTSWKGMKDELQKAHVSF